MSREHELPPTRVLPKHDPDESPHLTSDDIERRFPEGTRALEAEHGGRPQFRFDPDHDPDDVARLSLPTAQWAADEQTDRAVTRLYHQPKHALHWKLPDLQRVLGAVQPGDLVLGGGRTGGGKTLFFQNMFDQFAADGMIGLYIGTEQSSDVLRIKHACLRTGVHPRLVLAPEKWEVGTPAHAEAVRVIGAELVAMSSAPLAQRMIFANDARRLSHAELRRWVRGGVRKYGLQYVVVDHIDRMVAGDVRDPWAAQAEMIVAAKELAVDLGIVMFLASQVKKTNDRGASLAPPALDDFAGRAEKEREADLAFVVYRPLGPNATPAAIKAVRDGIADPRELWLPNVMGVKCVKHRLDESRLGSVALLNVSGHRLEHRVPSLPSYLQRQEADRD